MVHRRMSGADSHHNDRKTLTPGSAIAAFCGDPETGTRWGSLENYVVSRDVSKNGDLAELGAFRLSLLSLDCDSLLGTW